MSSNRKIEIDSLDFFGIRNNLKNYLSGLDQFNDFNFEGSGTSVLLDILAYVTHYQGFYNNMVANELFLDSAIKRTSVISHAKALGYTPSSTTAARATVNVTLANSESSTTYLTKHSNFTAIKDGVTYRFTNPDLHEFVVLNSTQKIARDVEIIEGTWKTGSFIIDNNLSNQRFIIPETNVDMNRLTVTRQISTSDTTGWSDTWTAVSDITELTSTTKAYFVQETEDGHWEIYFGDGILGLKPDDGNVIIIQYLISNGLDANDIGSKDSIGLRSFSSANASIVDVEVTTSSNGGNNRETIESIKFTAPMAYQSQNRNVTKEDYISFIRQNYTNASDVFVWGGEDNDPPEYGKVFVSVKPSNTTVLNNLEKIYLQNLLKEKNVISIIPDVVDPNYIRLLVTSKVVYDNNKTSKTANDIKGLVLTSIINYIVSSLDKFDRNFRYSKFIKKIDDSDTSILGNETSIILQSRIEPTLGQENSYTIKFENPIYHPHDGHQAGMVSSSGFTFVKTDGTSAFVHLEDDGNGVIKIYESNSGVKTYLANVGNVDYDKGIVSLEKFKPSAITDNILKINCVPRNKDILSERNSILSIDTADADSIKITVENYEPYGTSISTSSVSTTTPSSSSGSGGY